jgi:hypothetical protein
MSPASDKHTVAISTIFQPIPLFPTNQSLIALLEIQACAANATTTAAAAHHGTFQNRRI